MKGIIFYSSATGNTETLANEIYNRLSLDNNWEIRNIKEKDFDTRGVDTILLGGWAEGGNFNKAMLAAMKNIDLEGKKIGFFMTLGAPVDSEHGIQCIANLEKLGKDYDCIGIQTLQGKVSPMLMEKLNNLPDSVLPQSVKNSMNEGIKSYIAPTAEDFDRIANFFKEA